MKVEAIALTDFVHDQINAREGRPIVPWIEQRLAEEFERHGLVRIKLKKAAVIVPVLTPGPDAGKAPAAGQERPSSSLPAAPVSPPTADTTLHLPKRGARPGRRGA